MASAAVASARSLSPDSVPITPNKDLLLDGGEVRSCGGRLVRGRGVGKMAGQKAAVFAALFEIHIHDFEGYVLRAIVAHHGRRLHLPQAHLQSQLNWRSASPMAADRRE